MAVERLQKILAAAGIASRRKAEELITAGRISVNGQTVTELGSKADGRTDEIRVDGSLLRGPERHVYILLYKPKGYVTTVSDPEGRPTVMELIAGVKERVFPVGRLDYASEGLLLMTNDGELMQQLTKAAAHVPKTYQVKISGTASEEEIDKLRAGIRLPPESSRAGTIGGTQPGMLRQSKAVHTQPVRIELVRQQENPWYQITLTEGRNRQIRRMFEQIGHHVEKIKRIRYGALELDVEPGKWRLLKPREVQELRLPGGQAPRAAYPARSAAAFPGAGAFTPPPFAGRPARDSRREAPAGNRRGVRASSGPGRDRATDDRATGDAKQRGFRPTQEGSRPAQGRPVQDRPKQDHSRNWGGAAEGSSRPAPDRARNWRGAADREAPARPPKRFAKPGGRDERASGPGARASNPPPFAGRPARDSRREAPAGNSRGVRASSGPGRDRAPYDRATGDAKQRGFRPTQGGSRPAQGRPGQDRPAQDRSRNWGGAAEGSSRPAQDRPRNWRGATDREAPARPAPRFAKPGGRDERAGGNTGAKKRGGKSPSFKRTR